MAHDHPQPHIQHVALVAGRRFPRDRAGDPMTELLGCPFCGGNDLIRGVRYAKYSDTKDDAIRCQACDCNVPLKAWNARHVAQAAPDLENLANRFVGIIQDGMAQDAGSKSIASIIINELLMLRIIGSPVSSTHQSAPAQSAAHNSGSPGSEASGDAGADTEIATAKAFLREKPSTSYLQRKMQITYNHACSLMTALEREGFISLADSQGRRTVLLPSTDRGTP